MDESNKYEAKLICMSRCGLFPCKENYKFHYKKELKCRWCNKSNEDIKHILVKCRKCPIANKGLTEENLFNYHEEKEDKKICDKIKEIAKLLMDYNIILNERNERY